MDRAPRIRREIADSRFDVLVNRTVSGILTRSSAAVALGVFADRLKGKLEDSCACKKRKNQKTPLKLKGKFSF